MNNFRSDLLRHDLDTLVEQPPPVDLHDAVLRGSRQAATRRTVFALAVAVVVTSIGTALAVLPRHGIGPAHPPPSATATPTPISSPTPAPTVSGSPIDLNPLPRPPASPRVPDSILNATIDIPSWLYPAGKRTFVDGHVMVSDTTGYNIHADVTPVYADLDGQPGDETLIAISSDNAGSMHNEQLLALKPSAGGGFKTLGFVLPTNPSISFDDDDVSVHARVVSVTVTGPYRSNGGNVTLAQLRTYRLDSGAFHQVAGPTTFPPLPTSVANLDLDNTTLVMLFDPCDPGCAAVEVRFDHGVGSDTMVVWQDRSPTTFTPIRSGRIHFTYTIAGASPLTWADGTKIQLVTVTRRADGGYTSTAVFAITVAPEGGIPTGQWIVKTGVDGVTGIVKVEGNGTAAVITVTTADGLEVRRYERDPTRLGGFNQPLWRRVT